MYKEKNMFRESTVYKYIQNIVILYKLSMGIYVIGTHRMQ